MEKSKEEQSQRIMMEQVDKERSGYFICNRCGISFYCDHEITESGALCDSCFGNLIKETHPKQDKPVDLVCPVCKVIHTDGWVNDYHKCPLSPPIEDTNKTSLVVPKFEKIKELKGTDVGIDVILDFEESAINQLIRNQKKLIEEYKSLNKRFTLISLQKEK